MRKKQHYIPKFLLRNFSCDDLGKYLNIYLLDQSIIVNNGDLRNQCYDNHFYGKDQKIEELYQIIESWFGGVQKKLLSGSTDLNSDENDYIRIFILFQLNRTPQTEKLYNDQLTLVMRETFRSHPEFGQHINELAIEWNSSAAFSIKLSSGMIQNISDLKIGLLKSNSNKEFILGEQPVIILNPFLCQRKFAGRKQGLGQKGTVIVLPISPLYAIVLYDKERYSFLNFKNVIELTDADTQLLNYCQFLQTDECIYYKTLFSINTFESMGINSCNYRKSIKASLDTFEVSKHAHKNRRVLFMSKYDLPIEQNFSFIGIKNKALSEPLNNIRDITRDHVWKYEMHKQNTKENP
ncbi:hypothetical protein AGMMS50230_04840 [Spirochaetia bacterium]|nr:hypothetical protein AGMMS50230_04840 [Spirochaetia bacterium]